MNDYIRGERHGRGAHDIELDAMRDPLLGEALDGFDAVRGDHSAALERLSERVRSSAEGGRAAARARSSRLRERRVRGWSAAVAAVFLAGVVGSGVWLMRDGLDTDTSRPETAPRTGGYAFRQVEEIMPPVTVVPNDAEPAGQATDITGLDLDGEEVGDFSVAIAAELPAEAARDTVTTAAFRRYVHEALIVRSAVLGSVTLSFDVDADGRPTNIEVAGSTSPEAAAAAVDLLERGPDWPVEPSDKLIYIDL